MQNIVFVDRRACDDLLELFQSLGDTLKYAGPRIHVHVLPAQRADSVIVMAWRDENDAVETNVPAFSALGPPPETFEAFARWLLGNGWLER